MRIAVVTSNFGNFDSIKEIPKQTVKYDRYYYNELFSPFPAHTINDRLKARIYKILIHRLLPDYDIYIWLDANVKVKHGTFIAYLTKYFIHDSNIQFIIRNHPDRNTIYEEVKFISDRIKSGSDYLTSRYSIEAMQKEIIHIGPHLKGLYYCGVFARRNDPVVNQMCESWYMDNILWHGNDQINFVSNINKYNIKIRTIIFGDFYNNIYYKLEKHLKIA